MRLVGRGGFSGGGTGECLKYGSACSPQREGLTMAMSTSRTTSLSPTLSTAAEELSDQELVQRLAMLRDGGLLTEQQFDAAVADLLITL